MEAPRASKDSAVKAAYAIVSRYPGQLSTDARMAEGYIQQIVSLLAGRRKEIIDAINDPRRSRFGKFLPSIDEINTEIERIEEPYMTQVEFLIDILNQEQPLDQMPIAATEEERARRAEVLSRLSMTIRKSAEALRRANKPVPKAITAQATGYTREQIDKMRLAALDGHEPED